MPEPKAPRRAPTPNKVERATAAENKLTGPVWARALHYFYDPSFDVRSRPAFRAALNDFVLLPADERAFHDTHLLYRVVQGLESIHGLLTRIEGKLGQIATPDLRALDHLAPIRAALEEIASSQSDLVVVDEIEGEEEEEEDEDQDELGGEEEDAPPGEDPDFIYDTIPEDEPTRPRRTRRAPPVEAPSAEPTRPARAEPQRPPRAADPEREALIGDLVPASEGPHGAGAGDR